MYYTHIVDAEGGYRGYIYTYDKSGNKEIAVWTSDRVFDSPEEAEDAAAEYAEENDMEVELG